MLSLRLRELRGGYPSELNLEDGTGEPKARKKRGKKKR